MGLRVARCTLTSTAGLATDATEQGVDNSQDDGISSHELPTSDLEWDAAQRAAGMDLIDDDVLRDKEQEHSYEVAMAAWNDLRYDSRMPGAPLLPWQIGRAHV